MIYAHQITMNRFHNCNNLLTCFLWRRRYVSLIDVASKLGEYWCEEQTMTSFKIALVNILNPNTLKYGRGENIWAAILARTASAAQAQSWPGRAPHSWENPIGRPARTAPHRRLTSRHTTSIFIHRTYIFQASHSGLPILFVGLDFWLV